MPSRRTVAAGLIVASCATAAAVLPRSPAQDAGRGYKDEVDKRLDNWRSSSSLQQFTTLPLTPVTSPPTTVTTPGTVADHSSPAGKKTIVLCFGVNQVDSNSPGYQGFIVPALGACVNDANAYAAVGRTLGFSVSVFHNEQATSDALFTAVRNAAQQLSRGDCLIVTWSGHGGTVPDLNGDEASNVGGGSGEDQTWCLYNRMVIDDELNDTWAGLQAGVKLFVIADSCHSGTSTRALTQARNPGSRSRSAQALANPGATTARVRTLVGSVATGVAQNHTRLYAREWSRSMRGLAEVQAEGLLLAACQDRQTSIESGGNGVFTRAIIDISDNGRFTGTYREIVARATAQINDPNQIPNLFPFGAQTTAVLDTRPFSN